MAERQGFEPWVPHNGTTVFETAPFDRSGISPHYELASGVRPVDFRSARLADGCPLAKTLREPLCT